MLLKMSIVVVLAVRLSVNNRFRHAEIRQLSNVVDGVGNLRLLLRGIVLGCLLKIKRSARSLGYWQLNNVVSSTHNNDTFTMRQVLRSGLLAGLMFILGCKVFAGAADSTKPITKFELKGADKLTIDIGKQRGKVIFVNFWSLACIPCRQEMPSINKLKEYYDINTDVAFYSICLDDNMQAATDYFKEKSYSLKIYSVDGPVPEIVFRGELPTTVIIDKQGRVVFLKEEKEDYSDKKFTDIIDRLRADK